MEQPGTASVSAETDAVVCFGGQERTNCINWSEVKQVKTIAEQLLRLVSVKSLVTLSLTLVFAISVLQGEIEKDFMTIYTVVIAFYFGSQASGKDN